MQIPTYHKTATNPETGERLQFENGAWTPIETRLNPDTGERVERIGGEWRAASQPSAPPIAIAAHGQRVAPERQKVTALAPIDGAQKKLDEQARERQIAIKLGLDPDQDSLSAQAVTSQYLNSLSFGMGDNAASAMSGVGAVIANPFREEKETFKEAYARSMAYEAKLREFNNRADPGTALGAKVGGAVTGGTGVLKTGLTATRFVPQTLTGAKGFAASTAALGVDGAGLAALDALGNGRNVAKDAQMGGGFGAAANVVTRGTSRALTPLFSKVSKTTTVQQLNRLHDAASKRVERMGAKYSAPAMRYLKQALDEDLIKKTGIELNKESQPVTYRIVKAIRNAKGEMNFKTLREHANRAKRIADRPESGEDAYAASILARNIDEFIESAPPTSSTGTSGEVLGAALKDLASLTRRVRGSETIESATKSARLKTGSLGSKSSIDTTIRHNILQVLEDPKRIGDFTTAEREAMEKVIMGAEGQSLLRLIGSAAPSGNTKSLFKAATSKYLAGPEATAALLTTGAVSKKLSEKLTQGHVDELLHLIRNGVPRTSTPNAVGRFISDEENIQNGARTAMIVPPRVLSQSEN